MVDQSNVFVVKKNVRLFDDNSNSMMEFAIDQIVIGNYDPVAHVFHAVTGSGFPIVALDFYRFYVYFEKIA